MVKNTTGKLKSNKAKDKGEKNGKTGQDEAAQTTEEIVVSPEDKVKAFGPCQVDAEHPKTAILMLPSPELHVVIEALNCLQKFCKKCNENKRTFIELDGLAEARKLIFNENLLVQRFALKLMAIVSNLHKTALQLRDMNIAEDLIRLSAQSDDVVVEYATCCLACIATTVLGRAQIVQNGGVQQMINLLSHSDPDIQKNSVETIWRVLEDPVNVELVTTKASVRSILKLVDSEHSILQAIALRILEKVSSTDLGIRVLDESDAVTTFGEKLAASELKDLHQPILRILTNMSKNATARQNIVPLVPVISKLLEISPDTTQVQALGLLGILSCIPQVATALVDFGMCKRLIKILSDDYELNLKEAAAYCVSQLAQTDIRAKQELIDAIYPLLVLSETKNISEAGFEYVMLALTKLLEDSNRGCPTFVNIGGLCVFHRILDKYIEKQDKYTAEGISSLMTCLSLLTAQWNLRNHCIEAKIISTILNAAKVDKTSQFLISASNVFYGLLCTEPGRQQFFDNGGYEFLVELISHPEPPVVYAAVPLIDILGSYPELTKDLIERGILQVIYARQDLINKNGPLRSAFERLISTYPPAKYAIVGRIDPYEKLNEGFYDVGSLKSSDCFTTMNQMTWENRDPMRQVLYLNWESSTSDANALNNNQSLQIMQHENQNCQSLVDMIKHELSKVRNEKELIRLIASAVSDRFGGILDKWRVTAHNEDVQVADLQIKYKSVVIPITMITTGGFRTRALVFKAMCDVFGIPCSLERGEYQRMWNVCLLQAKRHEKPSCPSTEEEEEKGGEERLPVYSEKLRKFVVDLVYQPGTLLPVDTYDANTYCFG